MKSFNSTANLLLEHLSTVADGKTEVHMFKQFSHAALDVICKVTGKLWPVWQASKGEGGSETSHHVKEMSIPPPDQI